MTPSAETGGGWPRLAVAEWAPTRDTLQLLLQIAGKVRMVNTPLVNHWWNVTFYLTSRGLTTSVIPHPQGLGFEIQFDLTDHCLVIDSVSGERRTLPLRSQTVADIYSGVMDCLDSMGLHTDIWPVPVEIPGTVTDFPSDRLHSTYDPEQAHRFFVLLVRAERVFNVFRSRFLGKCSPVHLFWGSLDLAVTRFSGRPAPPYSGGAPHCGPHVMLEAYSHEVSSCGYWPGPDGEGIFYSYAYPEPTGYGEANLRPAEAFYSKELGEFVLPYEKVRTAGDPDSMLLEFLQSSYEAAANCAHWDRAGLERAAEHWTS